LNWSRLMSDFSDGVDEDSGLLMTTLEDGDAAVGDLGDDGDDDNDRKVRLTSLRSPASATAARIKPRRNSNRHYYY